MENIEKDLMAIREAKKQMVTVRKVDMVNALNLLICHTTQEDMFDTKVGLALVLERLGLTEECVIYTYPNENKLRISLITEPDL